MLSLFSAIRNARNRKEVVRESAASMSQEVRSELTHQISSVMENEELEEIQDLLAALELKLIKAVESEEFVGMRFRRYQTMLRKKAEELQPPAVPEDDDLKMPAVVEAEHTVGQIIDSDDDDDDDEEFGQQRPTLSPQERQKQLLKLHRDEQALAKVEHTYQTLQANVLAFKKRIFALQHRRDLILGKTEECREFLIAAAIAEDQQAVFEDHAHAGGDLELKPLHEDDRQHVYPEEEEEELYAANAVAVEETKEDVVVDEEEIEPAQHEPVEESKQDCKDEAVPIETE